MEKKESLFNKIISDLNIATSRISLPITVNRMFPDLGLRSTLFGPDAPFTDRLPDMELTVKKQPIILLRDQFRCHYFFGSDPERAHIYLVGPYVHKTLTIAEINHILVKNGISYPDMNYLRLYYHSLPVIRDENLMYTILHAHCVDVYGPDGFEIFYEEIIPGKHHVRPVSDKPAGYRFQRDFSERTYTIEKQMLACIREGNYKGAEAAIKKLERQGAESRAASTLRNDKNYGIVFNTLCRLAVSESGAPAWKVDELSRFYSVQIENISSMPELISLREESLREYCRLAREASEKPYSSIVQSAVDHIHSDFGQNITLEETAHDLNISAGYLSGLFRKETGRTFSGYLSDIRIDHARYLLENSSLPVLEIAMECGIPDPNYFSRLFKQKENMTPLQYRKMKQK